MRELGFNAVRFWVQWRWAHRVGDRFAFDDLDVLMDLAQANELQVTLNAVFDVAPHWLYEKHPDARQILNDGRVVEPYAVAHRQLGGHPGPCYSHPGAREERRTFLGAALEHFRVHPALAMWDLWNEPELCFPQRQPNVETLACYCPYCREGFRSWLKVKYRDLARLNQVWGRCYETWEQVEMPRSAQLFADFIDWREFHIDTMSAEAAWRLEMTRALDPERVSYLHVVPNVMSVFNSVSCCADDFALARHCEVFGATTFGGQVYVNQVLSAAHGKVSYNVESHLNGGCTAMHPRVLGLQDVLTDFLPQIGLGIRGFLFWQYRPEVLGFEAPAWGLVGLDGSDRPVTQAVRTFWERLSPHAEAILACPPRLPAIGIWKSRKNEIFHFGMHGELAPLIDSVEAYAQALYWGNHTYRFVSGEMLATAQLDGLRLLIMPSCYCLTEEEAHRLDEWVRAGGVLLCEAHLAGYNGTQGRHSRVLPGCGLAESWGLREVDTTSSYHLRLEWPEAYLGAATADVEKALDALGTSGGQHFPIRLASGAAAWGASRYAVVAGVGLTTEGCFEPGVPCLASKAVGEGLVLYCGTNLGQGAKMEAAGLLEVLGRVLERAGVTPVLGLRTPTPGQVRVDLLEDGRGPRFLVIWNRSEQEQRIELDCAPTGRGLFSGWTWPGPGAGPIGVPGGFADLIVLRTDEQEV
jgi:beta-galactosidase